MKYDMFHKQIIWFWHCCDTAFFSVRNIYDFKQDNAWIKCIKKKLQK